MLSMDLICRLPVFPFVYMPCRALAVYHLRSSSRSFMARIPLNRSSRKPFSHDFLLPAGELDNLSLSRFTDSFSPNGSIAAKIHQLHSPSLCALLPRVRTKRHPSI